MFNNYQFSNVFKRPNPISKVKFGGSPFPMQEEPLPPVEQPQDDSSLLSAFFKPAPNKEALLAHIKNMPTMDEYKPGKMGRVIAAIQGFAGGPQAAINSLSLPYKQHLEQWANKLQGLEAGAKYEDNFDDMIKLMNAKNSADYNKGRLAATNKGNDIRAEHYSNIDEAAKNDKGSDFQIVKGKNGNYFSVHKTDDKKSFDTGIKFDPTSKDDKLQLIKDEDGNWILGNLTKKTFEHTNIKGSKPGVTKPDYVSTNQQRDSDIMAVDELLKEHTDSATIKAIKNLVDDSDSSKPRVRDFDAWAKQQYGYREKPTNDSEWNTAKDYYNKLLTELKTKKDSILSRTR